MENGVEERKASIRVFSANPWVMPHEPPEIIAVFREHGRLIELPARRAFSCPAPGVALVEKGAAVCSFSGLDNKSHVFSLCLPGRAFGKLDPVSVEESEPAEARTLRPSSILWVPRDTWLECIRSSVPMMEACAAASSRRHRCAMEGMVSNCTQTLDLRLRRFLYALIASHYEAGKREWNPCPIALTVTDIAKIVSASRGLVSCTLSGWAAQGLSKKDGRFLVFHTDLFRDFIGAGGASPAAA